MRVFMSPITGLLVVILIFLSGLQAFASEQETSQQDRTLFEIPLEELLEIEITTSARRPQPLGRAASAVYVITKEDIRQFGVTRLADLFRLVPGMDVVRTANSYLDFAVSPRGFAKQRSRRMQVLVDGRPVYDGFKGGVSLTEYPIFLENIERIEVIRGTGGVTWGVNAINGVINIITKKASDTQGGLAYGGFGNRALQQGFIRLGDTKGPLAWRGTVGAFHDNGFGKNNGNDLRDWFQAFQTTGRAEYKLNADTELIVSGGHKFSTFGRPTTNPFKRSMQYMDLRWERKLAEDSSFNVRWSETYYKQFNTAHDLRTREDMIEIQHNFSTENHSIVWGADYTRDSYNVIAKRAGFVLATPDSFGNDQASAFIEDEITLADNLWFTIGYRGHYNELTHFDWAGRIALVWEAAPNHFFRAALSRAFRRPIFAEEFTDQSFLQGNDSLKNERLVAYELGYRGRLAKNLELNIEGFLNKHKDLMGTTRSNNVSTWNNVLDTKTYGLETAIDWKPYKWWLVRASHSYEHQTEDNKINNSATGRLAVFRVPKHKATLTNRFYLDDSTTLNTNLFWSDEYLNLSSTPKKLDSYYRFDIRLARRIWNDAAELAFGVTNLTSHFHDESGLSETGLPNQKIPRQVYFQFFYEF